MKKLIALTLILTMMLCVVSPASAAYQKCYSDPLQDWSLYYAVYMNVLTEDLPEGMVVDTPYPNGIIEYDKDSFTYGSNTGIGVVHGGCYSPNNTVIFGCGTSLDEDDNCWYVSITYSPECNADTITLTSIGFLLASIKVGLPLDGNDLDGLIEFMKILLSQDDIAVQAGDYVLVHKVLEGSRHLLAIDTLTYYDEFYYNDTENYIVLE